MRTKRFPLVCAALALGAVPLAAAPPVAAPAVPLASVPAESDATTDPVLWSLRPRSVLLDDTEVPLRLACGHYGVFELTVEGPSASRAADKELEPPSCPELACGEESPALYPSGFGSMSLLLDAPAGEPAGLAKAADKAAPWIPCAGGTCFSSVGLETYTPVLPWTAVIDWHDLHGWSVGWTILGIADRTRHEAVLLPLDEARLLPFSRTGSTDVHVLTQLCAIAEAVEIRGIAPPRVINMSFGRRLRDEDGTSAATCDPTALSCQIARVLDRLTTTAPGARAETVAVASSGNDRRALFPAGLEAVLPAGSLQLGLFEQIGGAKASWETPTYAPRAEALMPGYGLCIGSTLGVPSAHEWAAPAGTSYAAAVFSGWLSETLDLVDVDDPLAPRPWFPLRQCGATGGCVHLLSHGNKTYRNNPRIDALFLRMFDSGRPCGGPAQVAPDEMLKMSTSPAKEDELPAETFLDVFADFKAPAPPSSPCVPCRGLTSIDGGSAGFTKANPTGLVIDLSGLSQLAPPFPPALAAQTELEDLFLRVGEGEFLRLSPGSGATLGETGLASGAVRGLRIVDIPDLRSGAQPSLVFVLRPVGELLSHRPFWISIPILVDK